MENKKNNFEEYSAFFGFLRRVRRPNGSWYVRVLWGRILVALACLVIVGWVALSIFIYITFRYVRDYSEMTFVQAITFPFNQTAHRERMGEFNIKQAQAFVKQQKWKDAYLNLEAGVARSPKNIEGRRMLAEFYLIMFKRPDLAINKLEGGLIFAKEDPQFIRLYMRLLLDQSEDTRIVAVGEKLLKSENIKNMQVRAYLTMTLATVYAMHGNYATSEKYIKQLGLDKTMPGIMRLSKNEWEQGDKDAAIKIILDNINSMENKELLYGMLVSYYLEMGDLDTARRYSVLRSSENPFSIDQRIEYLRLLRKSGDEKQVKKEVNELFNQYKDNNRNLLNLANFATDVCDVEFMRRIYDSALKSNFPMAPYCLLWLESMIANENYVEATKFAEEIMREKPLWIKQYEDIFACLRSISYFGEGNVAMGEALINDVIKRGKVSPRVLFSTARRFEDLGLNNIAIRLLTDAVERFPRHQMALTNLIRMEIKSGNSVNLDKHISTLLQMRRPSRSLVEYARDNLISDRFIFAPQRQKTIDEINSMMTTKSLDSASGDSGAGRITDTLTTSQDI